MRSTIRGVRIAILALASYWLLLTIGTHMPPGFVGGLHQFDKFIHCGAFAGLAFLIAWAVPNSVGRPSQNVVTAAFIAAGYAAIDELTQIPVGRTADLWDFIADLLGVLLGLLVYMASRRILVSYGFRLQP